MNAIDMRSPIPLHVQVETFLRQLIQEEPYRNGKMLPKEELLSKELGVSRNTFRAAMNNLVREGLVTRKKGVGTMVTVPKITTSLTQWDSFTREMDRQGRTIRTLTKKVQWIQADKRIAAEMGIETGVDLCRLDRIKGVEGEPVVVFMSYLHPRVQVAREETFDGRLYDVLEQKYHCVAVTSEEEIGAIQAAADLQEMLQSPADVPLLYRKRHVLGPTDKLLELCYAYYRSDRFVYNICIRRL